MGLYCVMQPDQGGHGREVYGAGDLWGRIPQWPGRQLTSLEDHT